jgi:hypothetical protein
LLPRYRSLGWEEIDRDAVDLADGAALALGTTAARR